MIQYKSIRYLTHESVLSTLNITGYFLSMSYGRSKKIHTYRFSSEEARAKFLADRLATEDALELEQQKQKESVKWARTAEYQKYPVGALLVDSWGYDQTNVDFYQVVEHTLGKATVKLRRIALKSVAPESGMSDRVVPVPDQFIDNDVIVKRISQYGIPSDHRGALQEVSAGRTYYRSWYH